MPPAPVVFFNSHLLPPSQTFIRALGEDLQLYAPYYVGCRRVQGLVLPEERTFTINQGGIWGKMAETAFKISGFSPRLSSYLQQLRPCLIHAQFGLSGALCLALTKSLRIPLIVHFRGADATVPASHGRYASLNHWLYYQRRAYLQREAQLFLTVSDFIRNKLLAQGFPEKRVITLYQGVDTTRFQADPSISRQPIVLFVGRLTPKKGGEYLIAAMARLQNNCPDAELVMIGDGPLRATLESLASQKLRRYQFLGVQPPDVVKAWMNRAIVLAAPSVTTTQGDAEGLPNVVMEAQSMGLPVVSTEHAGIPEAVIHGKTGFLTAERNISDLAFYCEQLLTDQNLWQQMSDAGKQYMQSKFTRRNQTKVLEDIYTAVTQGNL
jgi:glycosyltransferase involved in cell wall biosynthesis